MSRILGIPQGAAGIRIAYGEDPNQFGELTLPEGPGPHPVVIFIHGGFWRAAYDLGHARHFCVALAKAGLAVWSLEYRRVGHAGGGYPGTLEDVRAGALAVMGMAKLDLKRIVVAGHSAGGQLALWVAAQGELPIQRVTALAAVSDLRFGYSIGVGKGAIEAFLGGSPEEVGERYDVASGTVVTVPQVLVHGTADEEVPFAMSERFVAVSPGAELVALQGVGHYELIDPWSSAWPGVVAKIKGQIQ